MFGADADRLAATGRQFVDAAEQLARHRASLAALFGGVEWSGSDAALSRGQWHTTLAPALVRASSFTEQLGAVLLRHADEQRRASRAVMVGSPQVHGFGGWGDIGDRIRELLDGLRAVRDRDTFGAPGRGHVVFEVPDDGRRAVVAAMTGLADGDRIRRDEIEIRALDNGRYIVVLPGVVDLSEGFDQFIDRVRNDGPLELYDAGRDTVDTWRDNDEPTVRKMRYAYDAARHDDVTENEYATVVAAALEDAGVPAGANVMLIGHSFGAYAAVDLAAGTFNRSGGVPDGGFAGYGVNVTHVVAAGAETDWRFGEIPASTGVLIINNRVDAVFRAEDVLHADAEAVHPNHLEHDFWGGFSGYGHDEEHYLEEIAGTGDDAVSAWFADLDDVYAAAGTRFSVQVLDPNR